MSEINDALKKAARERKEAAKSEETVVATLVPGSIPVRSHASTDKKKRSQPFLALWLAIILAGALALWFYTSWQAEKALRTERDAELSRKTGELAQKQEEFSQLTQEKKELEDQFYVNLAALEESTKNYEDKIKNLNEQIGSFQKENNSLVSENNALKIENANKDRTIAELSQKTAPSEQQEYKEVPNGTTL